MSDFNKDDVLKLARAVNDGHGVYVSSNDYDYECCYCEAIMINGESTKHATDCPVLIAMDLLT